MLDFLEIIVAIGGTLTKWRFCVCFAVAFAVILGIYAWFPGSPWRLVVSIVAGILAFVAGIIWEERAT